VAALRALVDPKWTSRIFLPYDNLLSHGTVLRDKAVRVDAGRVVLASGAELTPDYLVLATGSAYPFPAKDDRPVTADTIAQYQVMYANLSSAQRVMLLGAGPVGLELAGEIAAVWPDKEIVLVDLAEEILPGPYDPRLRVELNRQLDELGVERVLGSALIDLPDSAPGEVKAFSIATAAGQSVEADIWFRCHGVVPVTDYLTGQLAGARTDEGYLEVTADLRVVGFDTVYALGDIAAIDLNKAGVAGRQADVVARNISAQLAGSAERVDYTPGATSIILPLGPAGGAGQVPGRDDIMDAQSVSQLKGRDLLIGRYHQLLGVVVDNPS
jgi:NADH dehydrogenase FAD-containing subunit